MAHWPAVAIAYLLGSIPFGFLIVKALGQGDIRQSGSGNIGAANVVRRAGLLAGVLTLLLDAAKGYLAVWFASRSTGGTETVRWMMAAALAAVIGHMFPVWLKFEGGKGVATGLGVFLPICREAVLASVLLWLAVVACWRYSSLGSIVAAATLPIFVYLLYAPRHAPPAYLTLGTADRRHRKSSQTSALAAEGGGRPTGAKKKLRTIACRSLSMSWASPRSLDRSSDPSDGPRAIGTVARG